MLRVRLEDTTYADAHAMTLAESSTPGVSYSAGRETIAFEIAADTARELSRRWTLRVLIDVDGDGRIGPGDYVNAASVPIPDGQLIDVTVPVKRV